jgi:predicted RNase H-like HicB family nuclease
MKFTVEYEREDAGRWIAEILELSGVMVHGAAREEALAKAPTLARRVMAERLDHGEMREYRLY